MEFQLRTSFKGLCDRTKIKSFLAAKRLMAVGNSIGRRSRQPHVLLYILLFINLHERACFFDRLMSYIIAKGVS